MKKEIPIFDLRKVQPFTGCYKIEKQKKLMNLTANTFIVLLVMAIITLITVLIQLNEEQHGKENEHTEETPVHTKNEKRQE